MKKSLKQFFLGMLLFPSLHLTSATYEIYLEDWQQPCLSGGGCASLYPTCKFAWNNYTVGTIAFASYGYDTGNPNAGVFYGLSENLTTLQATVNLLHSSGAKIKMSYGGASDAYQMWGVANYTTAAVINAMAENITSACVGNNLDGIDFDFEANPEAHPGSGLALATLIKTVRNIFNNTGNTDKILTLTIPAQTLNSGYPEFLSVVVNLINPATGQLDYIDHINFMEYCFGIKQGNTMMTQATEDITMYHTVGLPYNDGNYGIPYNKMALGMQMYCCNPGSCAAGEQALNTTIADGLTKWAIAQGLAGVFFWDLNQEMNYFTPSLCTDPSAPAFPISYAIKYDVSQTSAPFQSYVPLLRTRPLVIENDDSFLEFNFDGRSESVADQPDNADDPQPT